MSTDPDPPARRIGRPARIDRDAIARAVLEIGPEEASIKRVAAHLEVSVPGLYYYVRGKDDLLRLAAEYSLSHTRLPVYDGQHWAQWLREWGWYSRSSMAGNPSLMQHYLAGGLSDERVFESIGYVLDVLTEAGFTAQEAVEAWGAVGATAVGTAVEDIRLHADDGPRWGMRARAVVAEHDRSQLIALRALLDGGYRPNRDAEFDARLTTVLVGIAVLNGREVDDTVMGRVVKRADTRRQMGRQPAGTRSTTGTGQTRQAAGSPAAVRPSRR